MLTTKREQKTCEKYSAKDRDEDVTCYLCPLRKGVDRMDFRCKANSHYDRHVQDWVYDWERGENEKENRTAD